MKRPFLQAFDGFLLGMLTGLPFVMGLFILSMNTSAHFTWGIAFIGYSCWIASDFITLKRKGLEALVWGVIVNAICVGTALGVSQVAGLVLLSLTVAAWIPYLAISFIIYDLERRLNRSKANEPTEASTS